MKIIAVVATSEGIGNTKLAVSNLEQAAMVLGVDIKVESIGASGSTNTLDNQDIEEADAVIVATDDYDVDMARFEGKPLRDMPLMDAAHNAVKLVQDAENDKFEIYNA